MKNKLVKTLLMTGCMMVCVTAILGIHKVWYREKERELPYTVQMEETELVVKVESTLPVDTEPEQKVEKALEEVFQPQIPDEQMPEEESKKEEELFIQLKVTPDIEIEGYELMPEPEKTTEEKPKEEPVLKENSDITDSESTPVYEKPKENVPVNETPSNGAKKGGMIYIDGFGWIPNKGGGGSGTAAGDMYENGNKVGTM